MPVVIGTAGHIDHGKTTLVKALTGQDTDRLKEEKERGISIDLGFAHLGLPDGTRAGVVDVPGHERFIRNMLAGAHGMDLVLFTVAADDGVMPQTEEHLEILHLLGVRRAVFVITKADLVSSGRIQSVRDEIDALTLGTLLERSPAVTFSAVSNEGLDELRAEIGRQLQADVARPGTGDFRLPVDRVFLLHGHGLVVTGTSLSGEVRAGDRVRCLPGEQVFRVRSVHVHGEPVDVARWGQRVALNLAGHEKPSITRGHVVCHEHITMTSHRFDAFVELRPRATAGLKSHQRVRVHVGTAERLATLVVLEERSRIEPKSSGFCQIALTEPVLTLRGDRFIVRDETARRTLGGGVVLDPWAVRHTRGESDLGDRLLVLRDGGVEAVAMVCLEKSNDFALPLGPIQQFVNRPEAEVRTSLERLTSVRRLTLDDETLYTTETKWTALTARLYEALRAFHAASPLAAGMEMEAARDAVAGAVTPRVFRAVVERLAADGTLVREASLLRLPGHSVRLKDDEQLLVDRITTLLGGAPFAPPDLKQIEKEVGGPRAKLGDVLRVMERQRAVVRVSPDLYFLTGTIDRMKAELRRHLADRGDLTPAIFRDLFGTSRKYAIPLLEYLDRDGTTVRVGDTRRLKRI